MQSHHLASTLNDDRIKNDTLPSTYYICPEWIFDGEKISEGKYLLIENGYIKEIINNDLSIPGDATIIEAQGCTVMPGFFDGHLHFMGPPAWQSQGVEKYGWGKMAEEGYSLFPQNRFNLLRNGITSIIDMGSPIAGYKKLRTEYEKGKIAGPRIYFPGPLFTAPEGHPAGTIYTGQHELITNGTVQVNDVEEARKRVQKLRSENVSFIKIVYDCMWYTTDGAPRLDREVAEAIIDEAHRQGVGVYAHIGSEEEALAMVDAGVDGIEHSFGSGVLSDTLFSRMARKEIIFTPTLSAFVQYAPQAIRPMQITVKRAFDKDVILVAGTDYPASGGYLCGEDLFSEFRLLEEAGVSRLDVLRSATYNAAKKAGVESEYGKIAVGYKANLLILYGRIDEGPVSSDRIKTVFLDGNPVVNNTNLNSSYQQRFKSKHQMVIPFAFPDPVNGFSLGLNYTDFDLFNSGVSLNSDLAYSILERWTVNTHFAIPSPVPKTRVSTILHFDNMNRIFYKSGNNSNKLDGTEYSTLTFSESVTTTTTLRKYWKFYGQINGEQTRIRSFENYELPEVDGKEGASFIQLGFGAGLDLRDHENNPWRGILIQFGGDYSPALLSSCRDFGNILFDFRGYIPTFSRHVIATRISYRQSLGETPFYKLSSYGGPTTGRGFFPQRFTDRIAICSQIEYRFPVYRIMSLSSWVDFGQVQSSVKNINIKFHPSFGFGPRLTFGSNENSILAVDAGFSDESWLIYFRAGHAF